MLTDVNTLIGPYPFREVPHPEAGVLARVLERENVDNAWVGHLPSAFYRDPYPGNDALFAALEKHNGKLLPVPTIRPDWPGWSDALGAALDRGAPAIRAYPTQWGMGAEDAAMRELARACGAVGMVLLLTVRFEDLRQRHWMDSAGDVSAAAIRALARVSGDTHIVVTAAGRGLVEEVHWGLTPSERERIWWDISWLWGPPEDDFAHLIRTCGAERFVYGTGWPLRLAQTPRANLDLLPEELRAARLTQGVEIVERARATARR